MALLPRQNASGLDGIEIDFDPATVTTGDTLVGGQSVHLLVNNGSGGSINVVLTTPETVEGTLAVADRTIAVAAGAIREIPVPSRYNNSSGVATVVCSAVTSVTLAAVQGSATP
jgi:hypothetical protein